MVAVELWREQDDGMCMAAVNHLPRRPGTQFVSPQMEAPFAWTPFADAGIRATLDVSATALPGRSR